MSPFMQKKVKWPVHLFLLLAISACASTPRPTPQDPLVSIAQESYRSETTQSKSPGLQALEVARKMIGIPYRYGGNDPKGFDCSGLVQYTFNRAGVEIPRSSRDIFSASRRINPKEMQPGDLMFFAISSDKVSHVGIYADHKRFIHSPSSGKGVSFASTENPYWKKRLVGIGRY